MHGILVGGGDVVVAFPADTAAAFIGRILDQALMSPVNVVNVNAFMAIDAADLTMSRIDEFLIDSVRVPAPHLRSRDASTCNTGATPCRCGTILVHPVQVRMTIDASAAGGLGLGAKRPRQTECTCQPQQSSGDHEPFSFHPTYLLVFCVPVFSQILNV